MPVLVREAELKESLRTVLRGVLAIVVLQVLRSFAGALPGAERALGPLRIADYLFVAVSLFVLAVLVRIFRPLRLILVFYSSALIKGARSSRADGHERQLVRLAESLVLLAYLYLVYEQLTPLLARVGPAFAGMESVTAFVQIGALLVGLWILLMIWTSAQPLIDAVTGGLAETAARASAGVLFAACEACGTANDTDALHCVSCGARLPERAEAREQGAVCPGCATPNAPAARFCRKCGSALAAPAPASQASPRPR